jgi:hypothetical protein
VITMKALLASIIFISLLASNPQGNCRCVPATDDDTTRWGGNEYIIVKEEKVYRYLSGTVNFQNDDPVSDALVEVYTHPEYLLLEYSEGAKKKKKQRRIAACVTGEDGKFCFGFLPPGKYEMRVSQGSGINVTHIYVEADPYNQDSTDMEINVVLTVGN